MKTANTVFEKTYSDYLKQIEASDLKLIGSRLGLAFVANELIIPLLGESYTMSGKEIRGEGGQRPGFERCVILSKYLLLCPNTLPEKYDWTAFRDLKNAGPLKKYFRNDVEMTITRFFTGKLTLLKKTVNILGGKAPDIELNYDLAAKVLLLPKLPVIITFNDEDDEFPAACSVLFENHAESFLDAESLAILGHVFAVKLKELSVNG